MAPAALLQQQQHRSLGSTCTSRQAVAQTAAPASTRQPAAARPQQQQRQHHQQRHRGRSIAAGAGAAANGAAVDATLNPRVASLSVSKTMALTDMARSMKEAGVDVSV
jgi:hypothetical protein